MISAAQRLLGGLAPPLRVVHHAFGGQAPFDEAPNPLSQTDLAAGAVAWMHAQRRAKRRRREAAMLLGKRYLA